MTTLRLLRAIGEGLALLPVVFVLRFTLPVLGPVVGWQRIAAWGHVLHTRFDRLGGDL